MNHHILQFLKAYRAIISHEINFHHNQRLSEHYAIAAHKLFHKCPGTSRVFAANIVVVDKPHTGHPMRSNETPFRCNVTQNYLHIQLIDIHFFFSSVDFGGFELIRSRIGAQQYAAEK